MLPVLGSVGLILIVLEGSLDLELDKSKRILIGKSLLMAMLPLFALAFSLAWLLMQYTGLDYKICLINAIPLSVISSSIAIPSAKNLSPFRREFIVYESSFSDIIGVLFFNFILLNEVVDGRSFGIFGIELSIMMVISFIAAVGLALLLKLRQRLPSLFNLSFGVGPVNLIEINRLHTQTSQRVFQLLTERVRFEVAIDAAVLMPTHGALGENIGLFRGLLQSLRDNLFGVSKAIDSRSVNPINAQIERPLNGCNRFTVILSAPGILPIASANRPRAKTDWGEMEVGVA